MLRNKRLELAQENLKRLTEQFRYESPAELLHEHYVDRARSLQALALLLSCTLPQARALLVHYGIPIRARGGPNNKALDVPITETLLAEIVRDGVAVVAERLGVEVSTLRNHLRKVRRP